MTPVWHSSISQAPSPAKKLARVFSRPGVEATPILATEITWWHGNRDCGSLDSNFKWLLMSRILVAVEKMVASCYNRDQTWLCVYCWCQTPSGVVSPRGDHSGCALARELDTNNTHNHVWSLKRMFVSSGYIQCNTCIIHNLTLH